MKTLIVKLTGGLGNQLFTYCAAKRLAHVNNAQLIIDNVSGFKYDHVYKRNYMLHYFNIHNEFANQIQRIPNNRLLSKILFFINKYLRFENRFYLNQEGLDFDNRLVNLKLKYRTTYFQDLWQSENYFIDIKSILKKDLVININLTKSCIKIYNNIKKDNSIAVHVRFFQNSLNSSFTLNESYYLKSINEIKSKVPDPVFYIFSDKPELLNNFLNKIKNFSCVVIDLPKSIKDRDITEFYLMKSCKHHVTANSTFSWWAAWLCENKKQIVFSPAFKSYTGICGWGFKGLIPKKWNIIND
jgi:hypothetical protein